MDDSKIIQLYWDRSEQAIPATAEKYGNYCTAIAKNILADRQDVEECLNDTYLKAWNAMPPHRPSVLSVFLGKITRNLAFNQYRKNHTDKRGKGTVSLVLDELSECVSDGNGVEQTMDYKELVKTINAFLGTLSEEKEEFLSADTGISTAFLPLQSVLEERKTAYLLHLTVCVGNCMIIL